MASNNWFSLQLSSKYYNFLYLKWKYIQFWKSLSQNSRSCCYVSAFLTSSSIGYVVYKYMILKNKEFDMLIEEDFNQSTTLSKRRKKDIPPGLINEGNTCFANSVLQAISSCDSFYRWIEDMLLLMNHSKITVTPSLLKILKVLNNRTGNKDSYSLNDLFNSLRCHGWVITTEQQDAYEMLQIILSTVSEENTKLNLSQSSDLYSELKDNSRLGVPEKQCNILLKGIKSLPDLLSQNRYFSPFSLSFANKMSCLTCGYQRPIKFDIGDGLILNLQDVNLISGASLESCLEKWISPELVHNVCCEKCSCPIGKSPKNYSTFTKQISFAKLPQCLCIQLQRTYYTNSGYVMKNSTHIHFTERLNIRNYTFINSLVNKKHSIKKTRHLVTPVDGLSDLSTSSKVGSTSSLHVPSPAVNSSLKSFDAPPLLGGKDATSNSYQSSTACSQYLLKSVVVHYGHANNGHYVAYRRHKKQWLYTSDEAVKHASLAEVLSCNAYLLFYEKVKE